MAELNTVLGGEEDVTHQAMWDSLPGSTADEKLNASLDKGYGSLGDWARQRGLISAQELWGNQRYATAAEDSARRAANLGNGFTRAMDIGFPIFTGAMLGGAALGAVGAASGGSTAGAAEGAYTGGLNVGEGAAATMGTGGGAAIPAAGLNAAATAPELLGAGAGGTAVSPAAGLAVSPQALAAFGAGMNLPYAVNSGIMAGGEGLSFGGSSPAGGGPTSTPGGMRVGPEAGSQMGVSSTPGAGSTAPAATNAAAQTAQNAQQMTFVDNLLKQMKDNALALGLMGTGLAIQAGQKPQLPNQEQIQGLSTEAQATANQLLQQYRAGELSASQQASLEQLTRQTKNQLTQYFASIGQADSTAHQQALAQVDQQSLVMKQQMLDNMLQQGLQALGVASGPLNTIANYQLQQDQSLRQAFGNFATSVGTLFGRQAGSQSPQQVRQPAPTSVVQSTQLPESTYQPPA